jgi:hypothetical protein
MYYTAIVCTWEYSTLETPTPKSTPQQIHLTIILSLRNNLATFPYGVFSEFHAWCDLKVHNLLWGGGFCYLCRFVRVGRDWGVDDGRFVEKGAGRGWGKLGRGNWGRGGGTWENGKGC